MVILLLLGLASTVATGLVLYGARDGAGPLGRIYSATAASTMPFVALADTNEDRLQDKATRSDRKERRQQTRALKELHELLANLTLGLVVLHIAGVLWASTVHRENLVRAMITGRKRRNEAHNPGCRRRADPGELRAMTRATVLLIGLEPHGKRGLRLATRRT